MKILETSTRLSFDDVMIVPNISNISSRKDVSLERTFVFSNRVKSAPMVPIMASNMGSVGTVATAKVLQDYKMFTCLHKFVPFEDMKELDPEYFAPTIGIDYDAIEKFKKSGYPFKYICLDVANGYMLNFVKFVANFKYIFPDVVVIAGNVATPNGMYNLIKHGMADIAKIGISQGNHCLTLKNTGVGYPQISAINECDDLLYEHQDEWQKRYIIGDGGCKVPGDIAKGFVAGADFMMVGSMLAAHEENSEFDKDDNALVYGMSSDYVINKFYFGIDKSYRTSEGRVSKVKNRGSLKDTVETILGGLRSACSYTGTEFIHGLKDVTLVRVNNQYSKEYEDRTIGF